MRNLKTPHNDHQQHLPADAEMELAVVIVLVIGADELDEGVDCQDDLHLKTNYKKASMTLKHSFINRVVLRF